MTRGRRIEHYGVILKAYLLGLFAALKGSPNWPIRGKVGKAASKWSSIRQTRLNVEALEARELMSASPLVLKLPANLGPITAQAAPLDMTSAAQQMQAAGQSPKPTGPTQLYLNFDGWTNTPYADTVKTSNIGPFVGTVQDEQDIMYRVAEIFAPFNVGVQQIKGDGKFSTAQGASTIFIGALGSNLAGVTPGQFTDYPSGNNPNGGTSHGFNSDPYDIAFVAQNANGMSTSHIRNIGIANVVAHEAGHTFGLAHVRTDGLTDASGPDQFSVENPPDVMSYSSNNDLFINRTFNVTVANSGGVDSNLLPQLHDTSITLQDSFTYLQTVLGARPAASKIGVIDELRDILNDAGTKTHQLNLVDTGYFQNPNTPGQSVQPLSISATGAVDGVLGRPGDYVAYRLDLLGAGWNSGDTLAVTGTTGAQLNLMIFDESAIHTPVGKLIGAGLQSAPLELIPPLGDDLYLVVGGVAGQSGAFHFTIGPVKTNVQGTTFTIRNAKQAVTGQLVITSQSGGLFAGTFTPNDTTSAYGVPGHTPVTIAGQIGALVNGSSAFRFTGYKSTSSTTGDAELQTTKKDEFQVSFAGQVVDGGLFFTLTGNGVYTVKVTTTVTNPKTHRGTQSSKVVETLSLVSGSAFDFKRLPIPPVAGGSTGGYEATSALATAATIPVAVVPTHVAALDAVMSEPSPVPKKPRPGAIDSVFGSSGESFCNEEL